MPDIPFISFVKGLFERDSKKIDWLTKEIKASAKSVGLEDNNYDKAIAQVCADAGRSSIAVVKEDGSTIIDISKLKTFGDSDDSFKKKLLAAFSNEHLPKELTYYISQGMCKPLYDAVINILHGKSLETPLGPIDFMPKIGPSTYKLIPLDDGKILGVTSMRVEGAIDMRTDTFLPISEGVSPDVSMQFIIERDGRTAKALHFSAPDLKLRGDHLTAEKTITVGSSKIDLGPILAAKKRYPSIESSDSISAEGTASPTSTPIEGVTPRSSIKASRRLSIKDAHPLQEGETSPPDPPQKPKTPFRSP